MSVFWFHFLVLVALPVLVLDKQTDAISLSHPKM